MIPSARCLTVVCISYYKNRYTRCPIITYNLLGTYGKWVTKKTCSNCGATYEIKHDLPEEDYIERFCPFCGEEKEDTEEFESVEDRYEDWN